MSEKSKKTETMETTETMESPILYIEGMPLAWHSNMQTGSFLPFGNKDKGEKKMRINLVAMRGFSGVMYLKKKDLEKSVKKLVSELKISEQEATQKAIQDAKKDWVEIFFIKDFDLKKKNPLCVMLLKTYSLANFQNEMKGYAYETLADGSPCKLCNIAMDITTEATTNSQGDFYQTRFKGSLATQEEADAIQDFLATNPVIYDEGNLEENLRFSETYKLHPTKTRNIAIPADFKNSEFLLGQNPQKLIAT